MHEDNTCSQHVNHADMTNLKDLGIEHKVPCNSNKRKKIPTRDSFNNTMVNSVSFVSTGTFNHVFPSLPMHTLLSSKFPREI